MTKDAPEGEAASRDRLDKAREVYAWTFKALQASLTKLEEGEDSSTDASRRQDLFRAHVKQLQSVFQLEGSLDAFDEGRRATRIDLDAARAEINQRLARIRERS